MTKEELIQFLKNNLTITSDQRDGSWWSNGTFYVQIKLGEELISEVSVPIPT